MKKTKQYRRSPMASIHETAGSLHATGLMNKKNGKVMVI